MDSIKSSRRRFLTRLGVGGLALGAGVTSVAAAQEDAEEPAEEDAADEDRDTAILVETLELAAAEFYDRVANDSRVTNPATIAMFADFGRHHRDHAGRFADFGGGKALGEANRRFLQTFADQLEQRTSAAEIAELANDLETALASTHLASLEDFTDADLVELAASVLPVEAQHATAAGRAVPFGPDRSVPSLESLDFGLDVTQYPATTTTTTTP